MKALCCFVEHYDYLREIDTFVSSYRYSEYDFKVLSVVAILNRLTSLDKKKFRYLRIRNRTK